MIVITEECFKCWKTEAGGYTQAQLNLLGLEWPAARGWKEMLLGTEIEEDLYQEILAAKFTLSKKTIYKNKIIQLNRSAK